MYKHGFLQQYTPRSGDDSLEAGSPERRFHWVQRARPGGSRSPRPPCFGTGAPRRPGWRPNSGGFDKGHPISCRSRAGRSRCSTLQPEGSHVEAHHHRASFCSRPCWSARRSSHPRGPRTRRRPARAADSDGEAGSLRRARRRIQLDRARDQRRRHPRGHEAAGRSQLQRADGTDPLGDHAAGEGRHRHAPSRRPYREQRPVHQRRRAGRLVTSSWRRTWTRISSIRGPRSRRRPTPRITP